MVLGRDTYEGFAAAWPQRSGDPFSDKFNAMPKYVVSTTLKTADWNNSTILDADPFARVRELRAEQNLLVWGSPSLVRGLLDEGLVDELVLLYSPIVLGEGKKLFPDGFGRHDLKVVESTALSRELALRRRRARRCGWGPLRPGRPPQSFSSPPQPSRRRTRARSSRRPRRGASSTRKCECALDRRGLLDLRGATGAQLERVLVEERQPARAAPQRPRAAGDRAPAVGVVERAVDRRARPVVLAHRLDRGRVGDLRAIGRDHVVGVALVAGLDPHPLDRDPNPSGSPRIIRSGSGAGWARNGQCQ